MGQKAKVGKNRQDKFYRLAKEQGLRSRSSFKLVQLNKRHDFLSSAARGVVDLCAAPGGWMQIARKHMPLSAPCIGIDLVSIPPIPACVSLIGDITTDSARADLKRALREAHGGRSDDKVDVVLNDGSPNMGKAWLHDAYTQSELTLAALRLASDFLAPGGTFVTKVFRSNDYNSLLFVMNQLFRRVNATKPSASRSESAEIYVMCIGYRAPKSVDPRLLNPKYVFKDMGVDEPKAAADKPDLFLNTVMKDMKKRKRHRGGYADGDLTLFCRISVLDFCRSTRPIALMVDSSQFSFDPLVIASDQVTDDEAERVAKTLKNMPETTPEVLTCCEDLKVLARREFKLLIKWRSAARETLQKENLLETNSLKKNSEVLENEDEDEQQRSDDNAMDDGRDSSDEEENINEELRKVRSESLAKDKRKKRKANKLRNAIQRKIDMKIVLPDSGGIIGDDAPEGLFSFKTAKRAEKHGVAVTDVHVDDPHDADDESEDPAGDGAGARLPYKTGDLNNTWNEGNTAMEEDLDRWYKVYLSRKKKDKNGALLAESKERKRITKRKAIREACEKRQNEAGGQDESENPLLVIDSSESSSDGEHIGEDVRVERGAAQSREAALWFAQPMFQGIAALSSDDDGPNEHGDDSDEELETRIAGSGIGDAMTDGDGENFHAAARREAQKMAEEKEKEMAEAGDGFDVVPVQRQSGSDDDDEAASDSSFHSSDYDTDEKAEMVAIGRRMRQSKTEASDVLDEAYNRYTFDDPHDLPRWFADPDPVYRKRQEPVTKEQVAEMKEYIKALQAAPTKKEAEAKARRRARDAKKLAAVKAKATNIAEQGDVSAKSRMKAIEDLYEKAMKSGKSGKKNKKKVYQVVRPNGRMTVGKDTGRGRKAKGGTRTTLVDKRLKSDKRGIKKANARKKGSKR